MTLNEIWAAARPRLAPKCRACPVCDGRACRGEIPGCGAMGDGSSWTACTEFLARVKLRMDTLHECWKPDASAELFGVKLAAPLCLAPIGGMAHNYNNAITEEHWTLCAVDGAKRAGILPFTGDGAPEEYEMGLAAARANGGFDVPTIKPWRDNGKIIARAQECAALGCPAVACDVDAAAFANMGAAVGQVGAKSPADLEEICAAVPVPFIAKGVMTGEGARKCAGSGCAGIVVSTHGGRVISSAQATGEALIEIRRAVADSLTVIVDGGVRTGADIFKLLALGADAAMIGRPFFVAAVGGGAEGVRLYADTKLAELENVMIMTGCRSIGEIGPDKISLG